MNPLAAGAALVKPYFFSFGTACTYYGLTEQVFTEIYIACQQRRRPERIRDTRYIFVDIHPDRFFGFKEANVLGEVVQMATCERALLDALDRPRYAGGIGEVSRMVSKSGGKLSWNALLNSLRRWNESALVQRLGYLLDLHQVDLPQEHRRALLSLMKLDSKVHLGSRSRWGLSGKLASPWNIIENVPKDVLVEKNERFKRPIILKRPELPRD